MKRILLLALLLGSTRLFSQNYPISDGGTVNACGGTFTDDGIGGSYTDTPYTMTICPDNPGDVVQVNFAAFALQTSPGNNNNDLLFVYDGVDNTAPPLGPYSGSVANLQITATVNNATGCLTFVFDPNGPANAGSPGWEALIECTTPCANPTLSAAITNPVPETAIQSVAVCLDTPVSFSGAGSSAQPGFTLDTYTWDFADGTSGSGMNVSHSFSEPGEYVVNLTVADNNGCTNLNVIPLQVLVSTLPTFSGMTDLATCLGDTVIGIVDVGNINAQLENGQIGGGASGTTWTALPPQVVSGQTYLADGAGFSYSSSITYDFFEPGQVLESCDDLWGILVNMEHSYMGDLGIFVTCPNGTVVDMVTWGNGDVLNGNCQVGEPVDPSNGGCATADGTFMGVGYDYQWSPTSTNGTWGANSNTYQQSYTDTEGCTYPATLSYLPAGTYESSGNLCDFVGCPLNGTWSISITDNLGADNGYIFEWGLNLNPALYPGVTTFTPTIGPDADSSYWVVNGAQWITDISADADAISITPEAEGTFEYTYTVINSFGCQFDTTIQVVVTLAPQVTAGMDALFSCGAVVLEGGLTGDLPVPCADAGTYDYCYDAFAFYQQTYCADNQGDGVITMTVLEGTMAANDNIFVYDGPDTWPSPQIGMFTGDLTGMTWTATGASGCLTFFISEWDGAATCVDGGATPLSYNISCTSATAANFQWNWEPAANLDNYQLQMPTVETLNQTTTFTLTGWPQGHPGCSSTDEVIVNIDAATDPGIDTEITVCSTDAPFSMFSQLDGTPVNTGLWYDAAGNLIADGMFDPMSDAAGNYLYSIQSVNCETHSVLTINLAGPTIIGIPNDTLICEGGSLNLSLYNLDNGQAPFNYSWTFDGLPVSSSTNTTYAPSNTGEVCLTVLDACGYSVTDCFNATVRPAIHVALTADTTESCWPTAFNLHNTVDPSLYTSSHWELSDGSIYNNVEDVTQMFQYPGTYDVKLTLKNDLGCSYDTTYNAYLTSNSPPVPSFSASPQPTDINDTEIHFTDLTNGAEIAEYHWNYIDENGQIIGGSTAANPVFDFPNDKGGLYTIRLVVTDIHNCTTTMTPGVVDINDILAFFVPNTFTPNNDGVNDVLFVRGADIDTDRFKFQVFSRFGDKVFETADPTIPWIGDARGGEYYVPDGVYNWNAIVVSESTGVRKELTGSITVFR